MTSKNESKEVIKSGFLLKVKTNRKKWFVLRSLKSGFSKLEYYDDFKKFSNGSRAKRIIDLDECFNISKKSDRKNKNCIMMFTKDDCFLIGCENEEEASDWLSAMWQLQNKNSTNKRENFEHIWPITLLKKGLAATKIINPGSYRLCLSSIKLILFKTTDAEQKQSFTFSMIRRVGHRQNVFFFEIGRSAATGPGELYLQVEDKQIAELVHCSVVNHMKETSFSLTDGQTAAASPFRNRSHSSAADRKKNSPTDVKEQCAYRNKTLSTSSISRSNTISNDIETNKIVSRRHSPSRTRGSARHTSCFSPTSLAVAGLADLQVDLPPSSLSTSSSPLMTSGGIGGEHFLSKSQENREESSYLSMGTPLSTTKSYDYFDMSPANIEPSLDMNSAGTEYFDMKPTSLETVQEKLQNEQAYSNISTQNFNKISERLSSFSDEVVCEELPKRAYSVGSKASALAARLRNQIDDTHKYNTTRTYSFEGNTEQSDYYKSSSAPHLPFDPNFSNRDSTLFMEVDFIREPQPSHQYLNRPRSHSHGHKDLKQRTQNFNSSSLLKNSAENCNSVLVSTVTHSNSTMPRQRTRTISQDNYRPRTSSFGEVMRPRSSSSGQRSSIQRPYISHNRVTDNIAYVDITLNTTDYVNTSCGSVAPFAENKSLQRKSSLIGSDTSNENLQPQNSSSLTDYMIFEPSSKTSSSSSSSSAIATTVNQNKIRVVNTTLRSESESSHRNIYANVEAKHPSRPVPTPPSQQQDTPPYQQATPTKPPASVPAQPPICQQPEQFSEAAAIKTSTQAVPPATNPGKRDTPMSKQATPLHQRRPVLMNCELDCSMDLNERPLLPDNAVTDPFNLGAKESTPASREAPPMTASNPPPATSAGVEPNPRHRQDNLTPSERLVFEDEGRVKSQILDLQLTYAQLDMAEGGVCAVSVCPSHASLSASSTPLARHSAHSPDSDLLPGYTQIDFSESPQRHLKTGC